MSRGFHSESSEAVAIPNASIIAETEKAILVDAPDLDGETWIPKSQVHDDSPIWKKGETGNLFSNSMDGEKARPGGRMKRYVNLGHQINLDGPPQFAFFDTVVDRFESHSGNQVWETWQEFVADFEGDDLPRYVALFPKDT